MNPVPTSPDSAELVSALVDGQLKGAQWHQALAACEQDPTGLDRWHDYHLIGDILRSPGSATGDLPAVRRDQDFLHRLQSRLALEAVSTPPNQVQSPKAAPKAIAHASAANDSRYTWRAVAALAGVASTGLLAWQLWSDTGDAGPALAQSQSPPGMLIATPQGVLAQDADLDALLAAHREQGSASALQIPSGFLRNATFDTPASAGLSASGR